MWIEEDRGMYLRTVRERLHESWDKESSVQEKWDTLK